MSHKHVFRVFLDLLCELKVTVYRSVGNKKWKTPATTSSGQKKFFLPSGRKAPTSWPLCKTKLPLSGTVEQKNSIQIMVSKKESLRSHVWQPRLRLGRQLHVIWDISYFTWVIIYYFSHTRPKVPHSRPAQKRKCVIFGLGVRKNSRYTLLGSKIGQSISRVNYTRYGLSKFFPP